MTSFGDCLSVHHSVDGFSKQSYIYIFTQYVKHLVQLITYIFLSSRLTTLHTYIHLIAMRSNNFTISNI